MPLAISLRLISPLGRLFVVMGNQRSKGRPSRHAASGTVSVPMVVLNATKQTRGKSKPGQPT